MEEVGSRGRAAGSVDSHLAEVAHLDTTGSPKQLRHSCQTGKASHLPLQTLVRSTHLPHSIQALVLPHELDELLDPETELQAALGTDSRRLRQQHGPPDSAFAHPRQVLQRTPEASTGTVPEASTGMACSKCLLAIITALWLVGQMCGGDTRIRGW